jgi:hypothetical protein
MIKYPCCCRLDGNWRSVQQLTCSGVCLLLAGPQFEPDTLHHVFTEVDTDE